MCEAVGIIELFIVTGEEIPTRRVNVMCNDLEVLILILYLVYLEDSRLRWF